MSIIKKARNFGLLGFALCGICCALPVVSSIFGMASLTAAGFYFDRMGYFFLVLAVLFLGYAGSIALKKVNLRSTKIREGCKCNSDKAPLL